MVEPTSYRELAEQPGMIMYSIRSPITRGMNPVADELVHFIFNTITDENNAHHGIIVDGNFEILTSKILLFASVDEFFALVNYMARNGIVVAQ